MTKLCAMAGFLQPARDYHNDNRFCSTDCRYRHLAREKAAKRAANRQPRECLTCRESYLSDGTVRGKHYCSGACPDRRRYPEPVRPKCAAPLMGCPRCRSYKCQRHQEVTA